MTRRLATPDLCERCGASISSAGHDELVAEQSKHIDRLSLMPTWSNSVVLLLPASVSKVTAEGGRTNSCDQSGTLARH